MNPSPQIAAFIEEWEGLRCEAYDDGGGVWTIGIGRTLGVHEGDTCTVAEAREWFVVELGGYARRLKRYMRREPSQQQFDALVSLAYNAGSDAVGKAGIMSLFNAYDDRGCADRFLQWNKDGGRVVLGLTKRREAERVIYLWGDYSGRP